MVGVEPARIWQQPQTGVAQPFLLPARHRVWPLECDTVGTDTDDRDPAWSVLADLSRQSALPGYQLLGGQLGRRGRGSRHQVGDTILAVEKKMFLPRCQKPFREPGSE
jgi:hypothetical protein